MEEEVKVGRTPPGDGQARARAANRGQGPWSPVAAGIHVGHPIPGYCRGRFVTLGALEIQRVNLSGKCAPSEAEPASGRTPQHASGMPALVAPLIRRSSEEKEPLQNLGNCTVTRTG